MWLVGGARPLVCMASTEAHGCVGTQSGGPDTHTPLHAEKSAGGMGRVTGVVRQDLGSGDAELEESSCWRRQHTKVTVESWNAAVRGRGVVIETVKRVCDGEARNAFCAVLVRVPWLETSWWLTSCGPLEKHASLPNWLTGRTRQLGQCTGTDSDGT